MPTDREKYFAKALLIAFLLGLAVAAIGSYIVNTMPLDLHGFLGVRWWWRQ